MMRAGRCITAVADVQRVGATKCCCLKCCFYIGPVDALQ